MLLLHSKDIRWFLLGLSLNVLAQWTMRTGMLLWIYSLTKSGGAVSLIGLMEATPMLLLAPIAGVLIDRLPYKRVLIVCAALAALLTLPLLGLQGKDAMSALLVVTLALNVVAQFFSPAASAVLPALVGSESLGEANSLVELMNSVVLVIAPALAAFVFAVGGPRGLSLLLAGLWLVSLLPLARLPLLRSRAGTETVGSLGGEWREGVRYVWHSPPLRSAILVATVALLGSGGLTVLDVVYVTRALHQVSDKVGILLAAGGSGQLVGGVLMVAAGSRIATKYHRILGLTILVNSIVMAGYAVAPNLGVASLLLFVSGALYTPTLVAFFTLVQLVTAPAVMGRVMSLVNAAAAAALLISYSVSGSLADLLGIRQVIGLGSIGLLLGALISLTLVRTTPEPSNGESAIVADTRTHATSDVVASLPI